MGAGRLEVPMRYPSGGPRGESTSRDLAAMRAPWLEMWLWVALAWTIVKKDPRQKGIIVPPLKGQAETRSKLGGWQCEGSWEKRVFFMER